MTLLPPGNAQCVLKVLLLLVQLLFCLPLNLNDILLSQLHGHGGRCDSTHIIIIVVAGTTTTTTRNHGRHGYRFRTTATRGTTNAAIVIVPTTRHSDLVGMRRRRRRNVGNISIRNLMRMTLVLAIKFILQASRQSLIIYIIWMMRLMIVLTGWRIIP